MPYQSVFVPVPVPILTVVNVFVLAVVVLYPVADAVVSTFPATIVEF